MKIYIYIIYIYIYYIHIFPIKNGKIPASYVTLPEKIVSSNPWESRVPKLRPESSKPPQAPSSKTMATNVGDFPAVHMGTLPFPSFRV